MQKNFPDISNICTRVPWVLKISHFTFSVYLAIDNLKAQIAELMKGQSSERQAQIAELRKKLIGAAQEANQLRYVFDRFKNSKLYKTMAMAIFRLIVNYNCFYLEKFEFPYSRQLQGIPSKGNPSNRKLRGKNF